MPIELLKDDYHRILRERRVYVEWDLSAECLGWINIGANRYELPDAVHAWGDYLNQLIRYIVPELDRWPLCDLWNHIDQRTRE